MNTARQKLQGIFTSDIAWKLLDIYFNQSNILVKHQLESFNRFVDTYIPNILAKNFPNITGIGEKKHGPNKDHWERECICNITDFSCSRPTQTVGNKIVPLYPNECRLRSCTYAAQTYVTISYTITDWKHFDEQGNPRIIHKIEQVTPFFMLPIMVKSKYCYLYNMNETELEQLGENKYELGGYFIIGGNEKVIISQERISEDQFLVWKPLKNSKYLIEGEIKSSINQLYYPIKTDRILLMKNPILLENDLVWLQKRNEKMTKPFVKKLYETMNENYLYFNIHGITDPMPIGIIFKALGIQNDRDILLLCDAIGKDNTENVYTKYVVPSLNFVHMLGIKTQEDAYEYLSVTIKAGFGRKTAAKDVKSIDEITRNYEDDKWYKYASVKNRFDKDILPHLVKDNSKKVIFIGMCVKKLLDTYLGYRAYNDRDHYANKRVDLAGQILLIFFRYRIIGIINKISDHSVKALNQGTIYNEFVRDIQVNDISQKLENSLATGNFIMSYCNDNGDVRKGLAELLSNLSFLSEISHMRKVQSPEKKNGSNLTAPRRLHESNYGMTCLNETPEGDKVGLVKYFAMTCNISEYIQEYKIQVVLDILAKEYNAAAGHDVMIIVNNNEFNPDVNKYIKVMVNNNLIALADNSIYTQLMNDLVTSKRHNVFDPYISVFFDTFEKQIHIHTEGGRFMRPMLIVENNEILLFKLFAERPEVYQKFVNGEYTWGDFLKPIIPVDENDDATPYNGAVIEYVDANQTEWSMFAMTPEQVYKNRDIMNDPNSKDMYKRFTHCEIHPITAQGMISSLIPFSDHTPNPRNNYQCSMGKQAIGFSNTAFNGRFDNNLNILAYGQQPLIGTKTMKYCMLDKMPHGEEAMLAIACYTGFNQEDSIIINKSSIDRGFFNTFNYRTFVEEENKQLSVNTNEQFGIPPENSRKFGDNYTKVDKRGFPMKNTVIEPNNVIIAKYVIEKEKGESKITDRSVIYKLNAGTIDAVFNTETAKEFNNCNKATKINTRDKSEYEICKVRVVQYRQPVIGDKFASRYAQKGTNSGMFVESDMPFTDHGEVPDIIMNPHGLPSRMTISKPIELFLGTLALFDGRKKNGTPFEKIDMNGIEDMLHQYGLFENRDLEYSNVTMYSGFTGDKLQVKVFYGPMYYQRLKHMVDDKIFWRGSSGPINPVTRQPADGRSRSGGLRLGEMERDALIAHNASRVLKGKFFDSSDRFKLYLSRRGKNIIIANRYDNTFIYNGEDIRKYGDDYVEIQLPYAMKLLIQYITAIGIDIRIGTD